MKPDFETTAQARYQSQRELGRGEDTRVDLVFDQTRQLLLARKTWEHASAELRFRLRQQHRRTLNIAHPNIARVYDLSADTEHTWLTMEFVQGVEAPEYCARLVTHGANAAQSLGATLHLLQQLTAALWTLHKADIVHRALKPRNWLVEDNGRAVLLDAGLAWPPQRAAAELAAARAHALPYVAPECLRGALHSTEADWYSLGALAFELITGSVPFKGSLESVLRAKDEPIESLRGACPIIPDDLDDLVLELLSRDPRARPTHEEIASVLAALSGDFPFDPQVYCDAPPSKPSHVQLRATAVLDGSASEPLANVAESSAMVMQAEQPMNAIDAERRGQLRHLSPALMEEPPTLLVGEVADELAELVDDVLRALPQKALSNSQGEAEPHADAAAPDTDSVAPARTPRDDEPSQELALPVPLHPREKTTAEPTAPIEAPALAELKVANAPFDAALQQIIEQLESEQEPRLLCVRGAVGSGKTSLMAAVAQRLEDQPGWFARTRADSGLGALSALHELTAQLAFGLGDELQSMLQLVEPAQRSALVRLCPALGSGGDSMIDVSAANPQQRLIDAHLGLRSLMARLGARQRVILCIDDADALDPDTFAALRALLSGPVLPKLHVLISVDSSEAEISDLTHAGATARVLELDGPEARRSRPPLRPVPAAETDQSDDPIVEIERLTMQAHDATEALALQHAAVLFERALRVQQPPTAAVLQQAAVAYCLAGRLRDAAKCWLALARTTSDPHRAQHFELEAAACSMRAGDDEQALSIMRSVLRNVGLHWPRTPLLTSTVERARALLRQSRGISASKASDRPPQPAHSLHASTPALRFEALWGIAKELVLHAPEVSDALCARALREAQATGNRSQLLWALGYEATSEANIGGTFMQRRAATLSTEVRELADASATAYDLAYASSVEAVVSWFQGDWPSAEKRLRVALQAYTWVDAGAAQERHVLSNFLVGALEAQGKLGALRELLAEVRLAALQTGHRQALALCELSTFGLLELAQDRPLEAIAGADALLGTYAANSGFTPLHFQHFVVTANARLYAGHYAQAHQQVEQAWQQLRRTHLAQLEGVAMMVHQLRARAALGLAAAATSGDHSGHDAERLRAQAHKIAASLGRSNLPHVLALRHLIEANVAVLQRHSSSAEAHCLRASELFDVADMPLYREAARMARGAAGEGIEARLDAAQSSTLLTQAGIVNPARFAAGWFPTLRKQLVDTLSDN